MLGAISRRRRTSSKWGRTRSVDGGQGRAEIPPGRLHARKHGAGIQRAAHAHGRRSNGDDGGLDGVSGNGQERPSLSG